MTDSQAVPEPREVLMKKRRADEMDPAIGRRIRALRLERGLSQSTLARHLGVSFQQLQKYEKGTNRVSAGRLQKIAAFLDAPITFFYAGATRRAPADVQDVAFTYLTTKGAVRLLRAYADIAVPQARGALVVLAEALRGRRR